MIVLICWPLFVQDEDEVISMKTDDIIVVGVAVLTLCTCEGKRLELMYTLLKMGCKFTPPELYVSMVTFSYGDITMEHTE